MGGPWEDYKPAQAAASNGEGSGPWEDYGGTTPALSGGTKPDRVTKGLKPYDAVRDGLGGVAAATGAVVKEAAGLADMAVDSIPGAVFGGINLASNFIGDFLRHTPHTKQRAEQIRKDYQAVKEHWSPHFFTKLAEALTPDEFNSGETQASKVMGKLVEMSDSDMESLQERSGGVVKAADAKNLRDFALDSLGLGALRAGQAKLNAPANKFAPPKPEEVVPPEPFDPTGMRKRPENTTPRSPKEQAAYDKARRADIRAAFAEDPPWADRLQREGDYAAEQLAKRDAEAQRLTPEQMAARSRPPERTNVDDAPVDLYTTRQAPVKGPQPGFMQNPAGLWVPETRTPELKVAERPLDSGLAKLAQGRGFDLTAVERLAVNKAGTSWNRPGIILPAAMAATGLGLALEYGGEKGDDLATAAMVGGALLVGKGTGLKLEDIAAHADTAPLKTFLDQSAYTLNTLEKLPPNRFQFSKESIEQLLKRPEVTQAERDVFTAALAKSGASKDITAKQLMAGIKEATGDWELTKAPTEKYADYGLEGIDRSTADPNDWQPDLTPTERAEAQAELVEFQRRVAAGPNATFPDWPHNNRQAETALRETQERLGAVPPPEGGMPEPTTSVWRLPSHMKMSDANHFRDPNYFGHTRSFEENGIRHVVEIQSDLAQKAGKVLTEAERASLVEALDNVTEQGAAVSRFQQAYLTPYTDGFARGVRTLVEALKKFNPDVEMILGSTLQDVIAKAKRKEPYHSRITTDRSYPEQAWEDAFHAVATGDRGALFDINTALKDYTRGIRLLKDEHAAKLNNAAIGSQIGPLLKNWYKRLVREELADAAKGFDGGTKKVLEREEYQRANGFNDRVNRFGEPTMAGETAEMRAKAAKPPAEVVRFATADTVAKVEGWPWEPGPGEQSGIRGPASKLRPKHQGIYDRYKKDVEKFLNQLGGKPYTDSAGHTWIEVPTAGSKQLPAGKRTQMFGKADYTLPGVLAAMGGSGLLASYLTDDKDSKLPVGLAAAFGAGAVGLLTLRKSGSSGIAHIAESALRGLEDWAGNASYQMEKISQPVERVMRRYKMQQAIGTHDRLQAVAPFVEGLRRVSVAGGDALAGAVLSGNWLEVNRSVAALGRPELVAELARVRKVLAETGRALVEAKVLKGLVTDYFPRIVADYEGLLGALGAPAQAFIEKRLAEAERMAKSTGGLTELERSQVLNKALAESVFSRGGDGSTFRGARSIEEVTAGLAKYYEPPSESLPMYLRAATNAIEKARLFGKHRVEDPKSGRMDVDASIGNIVNEQLAAGKIDRAGVVELTRLLKNELSNADAPQSRFMRAWQNLTNTSLLGNIGAAAMNLQDAGKTAALHGLIPTIKALQIMTTRRSSMVRNSDLGLANAISEEFSGASARPVIIQVPGYGGLHLSAAKLLDKTFKYSGFHALDTFGKELGHNAALLAARRKIATKPGEAAFIRSQVDYFGTDTPQLVADLRAGDKSILTLEYLWRQVSDAQPISSLEMPTARTANPNWRFLWQLKSFTIKEMTLLRQKGIDQIRRGDVAGGTGFLLRYGILVGGAGALTNWTIQNLLWGKDQKLEWSDIPVNVLKTFGATQYALDKIKQGRPGEAAAGVVAPPLLSLLDVLSGKAESVQKIPIIGKPLYMRALGGAEKADKREAARKRREEMKKLNLEGLQ